MLRARVWIGDVSNHPDPEPIVIVLVVTEEVVATVILAVEAFVTKEDIVPIIAELMEAELVKKANVEREEGIFAIPPLPGGRPLIVQTHKERVLM